MAVSKKERIDYARGVVMANVEALGEGIKVDSGAYVFAVEGLDGAKEFVEVKFVVKGENFSLDEAVEAYAEKLAKAVEREADKARKAEERALKEAVKVAKALAKEKE